MPEISVPFALHGRDGQVRVVVTANDDPRAVGCDLLDATLPTDAARGFPVCTARPETEWEGYAAACGWIQVVRSTDSTGEFEMDPLALFRGLDTPFAFFGIAPLLFDAPFRESRYDLTWTARAFLAGCPDGVMSRVVRPLAAFEWGFVVQAGEVVIDDPVALDLSVWDQHAPLLRAAHPSWRFEPAQPSIALRPLTAADLDTLFRLHSDPESIHMAAFTPDDPSDRERFDAHMARIMARPDVTNRAITRGGDLVGSIASYVVEGRTEITYWVDRAVWGQGVASTALAQFLELVETRPLQARAASDNARSLRVLEKAGFRVVGTEVAYAPGRRTTIEETILHLR